MLVVHPLLVSFTVMSPLSITIPLHAISLQDGCTGAWDYMSKQVRDVPLFSYPLQMMVIKERMQIQSELSAAHDRIHELESTVRRLAMENNSLQARVTLEL